MKRLNKLIDDFLSFSKPTPPLKTLSDVNNVVKKVANHFIVPEEYDKEIPVYTELGASPPIAFDENQIYHALLNLIHNAVHAIDKEGEIILKTGVQDGWAKIQVCDTGSGIQEDIREKIFEPFYTTKAKGTGLGLAIVNKIVSNHDGTITVSDFSGTGTCFTILLPLTERLPQ